MALKVGTLRALCGTLADDLVARGVPQAALAPIRPGGEENPGRDGHAWLRFYGRLCARRALAERDAPAEGSPSAVADKVILEALAGVPALVVLSANEAPTRELAVHPKSPFALLCIHERNLVIARLLAYAERLGQSDDPDVMDLVANAMREAVHQHRVLAWIACTPGPGLPFPELERDPTLPPVFADLAPQDIVAVCRAFDEVNWARLRALEHLLAPDPEADDAPRRRPSWSQFLGSVAEHEGEASERVLRDRSLVGIIATKQLAASAQREAIAAAKAKHPSTEAD